MSESPTVKADVGARDPDLATITLFNTLSSATLEAISVRASVRHYAADEHIIYEADLCEAVYFVLQGQVRIYRISPEGREQVLVRLGAGQAFNTVPPFQTEGRNHATVLAVSPVTLLVLLKNDFLELVTAHQDLAMAIFKDFADRLIHLTDLVENLALYTVQERLIRFLLQQADEAAQGGPVPANTAVPHRWTQQTIAAHLGTVRDVVGRALRALEDEGLIRMDRGKILLLNRHELERRARR
jgi:CRP/FNR family transcriptional regulator, cyclic AMP receptor protein